MSKELKTILIIGGIVVGIVALLVALSRYQASQRPSAEEALLRDNSHFSGAADAPVTLIEFGDYQCPACATAESVLSQVKEEYGDQLKFVYRNFPLSFHRNAQVAAQAAEAAALQGKFWEMHDLLYANQASWESQSDPTETFNGYATQLELDMDAFKRDYNSQSVRDRVRSDQKDGEALGVNATPTLYLNGQKLNDYDYNSLKQQIDQLLADHNQEAQPTPTPTPQVDEAAQP